MNLKAYMYNGKEIDKNKFLFLIYCLMGSDGIAPEQIKLKINNLLNKDYKMTYKENTFEVIIPDVNFNLD